MARACRLHYHSTHVPPKPWLQSHVSFPCSEIEGTAAALQCLGFPHFINQHRTGYRIIFSDNISFPCQWGSFCWYQYILLLTTPFIFYFFFLYITFRLYLLYNLPNSFIFSLYLAFKLYIK